MLSARVDRVKQCGHQMPFEKGDVYAGMEAVRMGGTMRLAVTRLLDGLSSPLDSAVLGSSLVQEVVYTALLGHHGKALAAITVQYKHARIARARRSA